MTVRWGVLSSARIGAVMVGASRHASRARFVAVASRSLAPARAFAAEHGLQAAYSSYEDLLRSGVDAVYVPLPAALTPAWTIAALRAGKHVLCEKPLALSAADAARVFDAASAAGKVVVEGLMWRLHPQTALARSLVRSGAIGTLTLVRAALSTTVPPGDIRRSADLGGGGMSDLGCYCVSAMRLFGGEPERVYAEQVPDGAIDLRLAATLRLPGGVLGQFDIGIDLTRRDELELVGTRGRIVVPDPWICRGGVLELHRDGRVEQVPVDTSGLRHDGADAYRIELDTVSAAIEGDGTVPFGRSDAIAQAATIEAVLASSRLGRPVTPAPPVAPAGPARAAATREPGA